MQVKAAMLFAIVLDYLVFGCANQTFGIADYSNPSRFAQFYCIVSRSFSSALVAVLSGELGLLLHSVPLSWPISHFASIVHKLF